ncbi:MAG TPA: hypothetical protein VIL95_06605 [Bacillota bacterium]
MAIALVVALLGWGHTTLAAPAKLPDRPGTAGTSMPEPVPPEGQGLDAVEAYAREHLGDTYAGLYLEGATRSDDGTVVLSFTAMPSPAHQEAMRRLLGDRQVKFRVVEYSLAELEQKQDAITQAFTELERQGVTVASVGVDLMRNRVAVVVTGSVAEAETVLGERFGLEMLEVTQGEPPVLLTDGASPPDGHPAQDKPPSFWQRLWATLSAWWRALVR